MNEWEKHIPTIFFASELVKQPQRIYESASCEFARTEYTYKKQNKWQQQN